MEGFMPDYDAIIIGLDGGIDWQGRCRRGKLAV